MSQKSSAGDLDIKSQQENLLIDAGEAMTRQWLKVFLVLKAKSILISKTNKTAIKACAVKNRDIESLQLVDDRDAESQQLARIYTGLIKNLHFLYSASEALQGSIQKIKKALRGFVSAANNPVMQTQLDSTELLDTGKPEPISELRLDCQDNNHEAADVVLQAENIAGMIKDLKSLQESGGVQRVAEALRSDMDNGIPGHEKDLLHRRTALLKLKPGAHNRNFIYFLMKACNSTTIVLLLILAILSFAFGIKEKGLRMGWYDGAFVLGAVALIVIVHSVSEFRNENPRQPSRNQPWQNWEMEVHVLRGGCRQPIRISDVLLGDIVLLEKGDRVPADGLLIPTGSLKVDDKAHPVINDQNPFLFYGSVVTDGTGKMLVTSVGAETKLGNMLSRAPPSKETKVEEQLNKLGTLIQIIGIVSSIIIAVVLFLRFKLEKEHENSGLPDFSGKPHPLKELIKAIERVALKPGGMLNTLTSFTLLLLGIAEGLPLAIAIAITCWNKRMLGDKTFAQGPCSIVTMASVTTICIDETGWLALIPQKVAECWIGKVELIRDDSKVTIDVQDALRDGIGISSLLPEESLTSMDKSILSWAEEKWELKTEMWKQRHSIIKFKQSTLNENIVETLIAKTGGNGPRYRHFRGPATAILDICSQFYDIEGIPRPMGTSEKRFFENCIDQMQSGGLESIAFARDQVDDCESDLSNPTMVTLVGLKKTGQEDYREVREKFREAGIELLLPSSKDVSMLKDIATAIGVMQPDSDALVTTGEEFQDSGEGSMDMATGISVMGNSLPSDVHCLVSRLKDNRHTVAVVGNTTNDIPSLKAADVGLTFAIWSTDIARKGSDIVIMKGNFTSILAIVKCGRCIYSNMRKYIQFQLTMTLAGLLIPLITNASHGSSPITTIQFHWAISLLTTLGGLALLMEPPREMLMEKVALGRDGQLITKAMWVNIFIQTAYQASLLAIIQSQGPIMLGLNEKLIGTLIFNSFFLCQLFNKFNAREPEEMNIFRGVHRSKWFWVGIIIALLLQFAFLEIEHIIAGDSRLKYAEWGMCLFLGVISWCIDLAGKCVLLMIKTWVTKPPRSVTSADPERPRDLELPLIKEHIGVNTDDLMVH
ncbi:calcium-transporting ATPase 12, plasma membrane-type-like [Eucalyptus grandis]|uniref:calcium-transporting ATPase 12, plasma membrane-type-like n=1 Tax=Eucalyptus grandis TaxID=71139 RepID=UPI00192EC2B6|nr:calcium-transporting ATPase 12, plasma membrane-type-like [Eucalyptus grandis]